MTKKKISNSSLKKSIDGSLKNPSVAGDKPEVQQTKPVPKQGKLGKEIDDIFGGRKKKKKPELEKTEKTETKTEIAKKKRKRNEHDGFSNNSKTKPRKRTEDGLQVFTEDELGLNNANAGDTSLCPFDCHCCF